MSSRWLRAVLLTAIVALALGVRLWAIGWGLPYVDHPDEPAVANAALRMVARGDWNPRFFDYPSLYLYALRLVFDAHWRYGLATGLYHSMRQLPIKPQLVLSPVAFYVDAPGFYLWGRALTTAFGAATVALLYFVGRRGWGARTGLLAAALLAALPFHVRHSQYITVDVACAFMALLAIGAALRILADGRWQTYALAGLAAGLAASTKYHAGLVVLPIALAHLLAWRQASLRQGWRLGIAALASILAFVAATPYALLTPQAFYRGIMIQYVDYRGGLHGNALGRWPLGAYLRFFWTMGLGPLPTLAALLGVGVAVARRDRAALVVLSFVAPFLLFFMVWPQHFWRNLMPIIPPLALFAAIGIDAVAARIASWSAAAWRTTEQACRERFASAAGWLIPLALAALVAGGPLVRSIELDRYNLGDDARMLARSFIQSHLPRGAAVAAELSPPQLAGDPAIKPVMSLSDHDAGWYRERGFRYLVVNGRYHVNDMRWRTAFAQLLSTAALVARFDDRPAHNQIGGATRLARSFASRFCDADVAVLDLQAQATAVPPPIHAELGKSAPCERSP